MPQYLKIKKLKKEEGFSLVEIIIVTAVITVALAGFLQLETVSIKLLRRERENLEATLLAKEVMEAARAVRDESWTSNIVPLLNGTVYYPIVQGGKWVLTTTQPPLVNGRYDRQIVFGEVRRNAQDRISSSGNIDTGTRKITGRVIWSGKQIELVAYITNFQEPLGN